MEERNLKSGICSYVVLYKEKYYVCYKINSAGLAQLIDDQGKKFSGTPNPKKLTYIKPLYHKAFNGSPYFNTKQGVFSAATGNRISHPKIIGMFDNKEE